MKNKIFVLVLMLAFILGACSKDQTPTEEKSVQAIYTSVALTLQAQPTNPPEPTMTPSPTETPTPVASPTQSTPVASATVRSTVASNVSLCDNSAYISDVTIPDGKIIYPGEAFTKTWLIENSGTCTWSKSYAIAFVNGNSMSGVTTAITAATAPGEQLKVSVEMIAPASTGTYTGYWRLKNASGSFFGQSVYVQIAVSLEASTITPTTSATVKVENTSTATATTPAKTATPTATQTKTLTVTPTATSESSGSPYP